MITSGIDLGSSTLRLLELRVSGKRMAVLNWGVVAVPEGMLVNGVVQDTQGLTPYLTRLVSESRRHRLHAAASVALPEQQTFLKVITVPTVDLWELADAVRFESGSHIPFAPEEVILDWQRLGPAAGSAGGTSVLLGAAPRILVDGTLAALDSAGIHVRALEIESIALARALLEPGTERSAAPRLLIDLGEQHTTLVLFDQGTIPFTSTLPFGQAALTRTLTEQLGVAPADAERAKRLFGLDPKRGKGIVRKLILPHLEELGRGITQTTEYYRDHFPGNRVVEVVLLTGGGSLLPGLPAYLAEQLKLRCRLAELPAALRSLGPSFATAAGLAQRPPLV